MAMLLKTIIFMLYFSSFFNIITGLSKLVITLLSQTNSYHSRIATGTKSGILANCISHNISLPVVHLAHEDFANTHYWTIFPLLPVLSRRHGKNATWYLFGTENTYIHPRRMVSLLSKYSPEEDVFLGRSLRDQEPTIIHHFAFHENPARFAYPDLSAGFLLSASLLRKVARRYLNTTGAPVDFSIDPVHELALYVWRDGAGPCLTDPSTLCTTAVSDCATQHRPPPDCLGQVEPASVHFAVKTCAQFHESRLRVVQETWAGDSDNVRYYSDRTDERLGTVSVGVPNTERGHCAKTLRILALSATLPELRWLVVADDDTIISVPRLLRLLACYRSDEPLMLGERYGFRTSATTGGYSYITGGGGMVFSAEAVRRLTDRPGCRCPSDDAPDDMQLGICAANAAITLLHSPRFHQARPPDYPAALLAGTQPVSFHKHWMIDPREVYRTWLQEPQPAEAVGPGHSEL